MCFNGCKRLMKISMKGNDRIQPTILPEIGQSDPIAGFQTGGVSGLVLF